VEKIVSELWSSITVNDQSPRPLQVLRSSHVGRSKSSVSGNSGKVASHQPGTAERGNSAPSKSTLGLVTSANCVNYSLDSCDLLTPSVITNKACCRLKLHPWDVNRSPRMSAHVENLKVSRNCSLVPTRTS